MKFSDPNEKFEVREVEVFEENQAADATDLNPDAEVKVTGTATDEAERQKKRKKEGKTKQEERPNYGWAFFLATMFSGIAVTATFDTPAGVLLGMGLGFLFFVDPIYQKVMDKIDKL
ncbi:MAG: hypothetical protein NW241_03505 [Bacteroidia bacterium]|nr:hypothetical protein [Bacteroidia bacterium]